MKKTVLVCDLCAEEIHGKTGAVLRLTANDSRRVSRTADLCDNCSEMVPGVPAKRRGGKPPLQAVA